MKVILPDHCRGGEGHFCWTGIKFVHLELRYGWQLGPPPCSSEQTDSTLMFPTAPDTIWSSLFCPATNNAEMHATAHRLRRLPCRSLRIDRKLNQCHSGTRCQRLWSRQRGLPVREVAQRCTMACVEGLFKTGGLGVLTQLPGGSRDGTSQTESLG